MRNSWYRKYLSKEDLLTEEVGVFLRDQYPDFFWCHIPNEGKRTRFEQLKFKLLGGLAGMPDIMIFQPSHRYNGLAIELKVVYESGAKNYPTKKQKECLNKLELCGWMAKVCYSVDDVRDCINIYLNDD